MSKRRFYCPSEKVLGDKFIIDYPDEVRHILKVMRFKAGDELIVFDGTGKEYVAKILSVSPDKVEAVRVKEIERETRDLNITLACALPKKGKFEFIIEKATELGVRRIIPLCTQRTEVKIAPEDISRKMKRWQKIAVNASKQSRRNSLPEITFPLGLRDVFRLDKFDFILIPALIGERVGIAEAMRRELGENVLILIGPEGDFTEEEVSLAQSFGAIPVSLGETVLKVDTAVISTLAIVKSMLTTG